jgi:ABC-type multidrug transport system ATPase subunit
MSSTQDKGWALMVPARRLPAPRFSRRVVILCCCLATVCGVAPHVGPIGKTLHWKDICYSVRVGAGESASQKHILRNIHGIAEPGRLIAIMGPTGSGKTSLLNVLAARTVYCKNAVLSGEIQVNGEKRDEENFREHSAYVQQDDVLYAHQTVQETLLMAARLRLKGATVQQSESLVNTLIHQLGLVKARNTEVGSASVRGVSGGERKRTNLGIELIADPGVLFLDEPTSGLDSFQAEAVVRVLSKLAQDGRTIFMSIHQPSSQIFAMFDRLMLLSEGYCLYYGPATEAVPYFGKLGYKCPNDFNPADFLLETISIDTRSEAALKQSNATVHALVGAYEKKLRCRKLQRSPSRGHTISVPAVYRMRSLTDIMQDRSNAAQPASPEEAALEASGAPGGWLQEKGIKVKIGGRWIRQFGALHRRSKIEVWRNPTALVIRSRDPKPETGSPRAATCGNVRLRYPTPNPQTLTPPSSPLTPHPSPLTPHPPPPTLVLRSLSTLVFAVALAGLYSKGDIDAQKGIQDRTGALFFMVVNQVNHKPQIPKPKAKSQKPKAKSQKPKAKSPLRHGRRP